MTMGALSLTRENALVLVVVVARVGGRFATSERRLAARRRPRHGAGISLRLRGWLLAWRLFSLPVAARNYAVGGGFYLTTSQFGSNLFIGNNPLADGSYMSLRAGRGSPEFERLDATELAEQARGRALTPAEVSSYWTERTLAFIREQPAAWLGLLARKTRLLWSRTETIDTESQESHAEYSTPLELLDPVWNFGVLLPLAVARRLGALARAAAAVAAVRPRRRLRGERHRVLRRCALSPSAGAVRDHFRRCRRRDARTTHASRRRQRAAWCRWRRRRWR